MPDAKSCSPEDGAILIRENGHRVVIGDYSAIIQVNNWYDVATGPHYLVSLDHRSTVKAAPAAVEAVRVILRLFPEQFGGAQPE